jgi:hypothetical protein
MEGHALLLVRIQLMEILIFVCCAKIIVKPAIVPFTAFPAFKTLTSIQLQILVN